MLWAFWTAHTIIAAGAVYDIAVLGFRPCWSDLGRALIVSAAYLAPIVLLNACSARTPALSAIPRPTSGVRHSS